MTVEEFARVQSEIGDIPGERGIALRRERYAPFFMRFGNDVVIEERCRFFHPDRIVLNDNVRINLDALIYGSGGVRIGRNTLIGPRCFIHSANHEISSSPDAFHERGYRYHPVTIGDNCLISANVSILPGAQLGQDTFVACGAVVTKAIYAPASNLIGTPAREQRTSVDGEFTPSVDIVLYVPSHGRWMAFARHLLSTLGLPQVGIVIEGEQLASSVHTVIVLGEQGWAPHLPEGVDRWTIQEGVAADTSDHRQAQRHLRYTPSSVNRGGDACADVELQQALFWLMTRLQKGAGPLSLPDFLEWVVTLQLLCSADVEPPRFVGRVVMDLIRRRPTSLPPLQEVRGRKLTDWLTEVNLCCRRAIASLPGRWRLRLGLLHSNWVDARRSRTGAGTLWRLAVSGMSREELDQLAAAPAFRLAEQLTRRSAGIPHPLPPASKPTARAHDQIVRMIEAHLSGDGKLFDQLDEALRSSAWSVDGVVFPRLKTGSTSLCYSPLVLAWLYLGRLRADATYRMAPEFGETVDAPQLLDWKVFGNGKYLDVRLKLISRSLPMNWDILHSANGPPDMQFVLESSAYLSDIGWLEAQWLEVFRLIQFSRGMKLIRLRPWPSGYTAAVSIRYDVDRPVSAERITELVRLQARYANSPCASWYFFAQDTALERQSSLLQRHWQERGIHALKCADSRSGLGVTHHSAPTSEYWQGSRTVAALAASGASYGEFLAAGLGTPRPAWVPDADANVALQAFWVTPLHFPLEGSTHDTTLAYFDRLLSQFHERLQSGGHAIIGSHPDLNQDILVELLKRERRPNLWFATIDEVVSRCRQVMEYGQVGVQVTEGVVQLCSRSPLADLTVEVWTDGAASPEIRCLQLKAFVPRAVGGVSANTDSAFPNPIKN